MLKGAIESIIQFVCSATSFLWGKWMLLDLVLVYLLLYEKNTEKKSKTFPEKQDLRRSQQTLHNKVKWYVYTK